VPETRAISASHYSPPQHVEKDATILDGLSATRKLSRNASAVSDAPRPTPEIYLPLSMGRVRYSCLKEAAGEEAFMQIQWVCGDEKDLGSG